MIIRRHLYSFLPHQPLSLTPSRQVPKETRDESTVVSDSKSSSSGGESSGLHSSTERWIKRRRWEGRKEHGTHADGLHDDQYSDGCKNGKQWMVPVEWKSHWLQRTTLSWMREEMVRNSKLPELMRVGVRLDADWSQRREKQLQQEERGDAAAGIHTSRGEEDSCSSLCFNPLLLHLSLSLLCSSQFPPLLILIWFFEYSFWCPLVYFVYF